MSMAYLKQPKPATVRAKPTSFEEAKQNLVALLKGKDGLNRYFHRILNQVSGQSHDLLLVHV